MKCSTVKLDENLLSILTRKDFDNFTVLQLRDAYLTVHELKLEPKKTRTFVYGQILRLVNLGLLVKEEKENSRKTIYKKSSEFYTAKIQSKTSSTIAKPLISTESTEFSSEPLENQLNQYKVDLLACIGESEEYMRLYESNPYLKEILESNYLAAREQSSKLLGQIKAIETVLSYIGEQNI